MSSIVWFVLLLTAFQRGAAPSAQNRATISGKLVRPDMPPDKQRVPNATIELQPSGQVMMTDNYFTFRNLAPGRYTLIPNKDGFMVQEDSGKNLSPIGLTITVNAGQNLSDLTIPMIPSPTISGSVFHPNGERLAAGVVEAFARRYTPYGPQLRSVRRTMSNDLGEYRLFWLNFGEYLIGASYSDRALRSAVGSVRLSPNQSKPDDGHTTVYYESSLSLGQSKPVHLGPGAETDNFNIVLSDERRFNVRGRVVSAGLLTSGAEVMVAPEGSELGPNSGYSFGVNSTGIFEIKNLAPGSYVALARAPQLSSEVITFSVTNEDIGNLTIPLYPTTNLTGRVLDTRPTAGNSTGLKVILVRSSKEIDQRFESMTDGWGDFAFEEAGPGDYDVMIDPLPAAAYLRTIEFGTRDALVQHVRIGKEFDSSRLFINLGFNSATVEASVINSAAKAAAGAQVVLVPEVRLRHRVDRYFTAFTDSSGMASLSNVPPGRYTAFAFERIEPGAYFAFAYDSRLSVRFNDYAASIEVRDTGSAPFQLKLVPAALTAGGFQ